MVSGALGALEASTASEVWGFLELSEVWVAWGCQKQPAPDSKPTVYHSYPGTQVPQLLQASCRCLLTMHDRFEHKQPIAWMYRICVRRALSTLLTRNLY
jgi:hypothetical protein